MNAKTMSPKYIHVFLALLIVFIFSGCGESPSTATIILSATNTLISPETYTPTALTTETPTPTETPVPTETPLGGFPQIYIGIPLAALNNNGCGGTALVTSDYASETGTASDFWQANSEIPQPPNGLRHRSKDGRRVLDYCTHIGYPITWEMGRSEIVETRPDEGIMVVLIKEGFGIGLRVVYGHVNLDTEPNTDGMQNLPLGTVVYAGDIIGFTDRYGIKQGSDSSTAVGIQKGTQYIKNQEHMLIGFDGIPNLPEFK